MTDSGGIQEEAPSLGKPVVVMRATTERPEAVAAGCALLGGTEAATLVAAFRRIADDPATYRRMSTGNNPYGDGHAAAAIVRYCDDHLAG
jgi:UDP-N-acetylglucosamine 2-epimerase (non-hydrolysing)